MFGLGKWQKIQFLELSRLPQRAARFSKLLKLVQYTPYFDQINSNIMFSGAFLCANFVHLLVWRIYIHAYTVYQT